MTRILAIFGGSVLLICIVWAATRADIIASFATISADPWGLVTLVDLYLGFTLMSLLIWHFETRPVSALAWIIPTFVLGNLVPALWLVSRGYRHLRI